MEIITRSGWGARYSDGFAAAPLPASEVWLHHSVTAAPDLLPPFDDDDVAIRRLEQIGQERFGGGISYTFAVTPVGRIYQGHSVDREGAHTKGRNRVARAIVLVGNYEIGPPTSAQVQAVAQLLRHGHRQDWWRRPQLDGGHRDAPGAQTDCPGRHAEAAIAEINRLALEEHMPLTADDVAFFWYNPRFRGNENYAQVMLRIDDNAAKVSELISVVQRLAADVAELKARPPVDVDEVALAAELRKLGIGGTTAQDVLAAFRAQLNKQ